jgi:hypothetical protein
MAGYFYSDGSQPDSKTLMAQALMGNNNGPFSGIGNALILKALQQKQAFNNYQNTPAPSANTTYQGMSGPVSTTINSGQLPYMGPRGLSGLFSFGGG